MATELLASAAAGGSSDINLDLIGIVLSIVIPIIAIIFGWYYSTRKRIIEKLINDMEVKSIINWICMHGLKQFQVIWY